MDFATSIGQGTQPIVTARQGTWSAGLPGQHTHLVVLQETGDRHAIHYEIRVSCDRIHNSRVGIGTKSIDGIGSECSESDC